jgi:cell wall-associated NlpC family hydrolase
MPFGRSADGERVRGRLLAAVGLLFVTSAQLSAAGPTQNSSWAQAQIGVVAAHGLLGGDASAFRPDDPLTAGDLADLVTGLTQKPVVVPADPTAPVTIAQLDAALVRGEGLSIAAARFLTGVRAAGLTPPGRLGTEAVARLLGLRLDHPRSQESLEPTPSSIATRAEAAYSAAKILRWQGWEKKYVQSLAATFSPELVSGWQQTVLQQAVSLIGFPYVWAGTSEKPQAPLGTTVPGGFDCSGFVWRVYKLASYSVGTPLASTLRGRTTYAMSGEVPAAQRILYPSLQPADVLFFGARGPRSKPAQVDHAGIYLGGGWMIDSGSTGVHLSPISIGYWATRFAWARRPLAEAGLA